MRFWDALGIVPLLIAEPTTKAVQAADRRPSTLELLTLDDQMAGAAHKEGFVVVEVPTPL